LSSSMVQRLALSRGKKQGCGRSRSIGGRGVRAAPWHSPSSLTEGKKLHLSIFARRARVRNDDAPHGPRPSTCNLGCTPSAPISPRKEMTKHFKS
jgi:hypothetical protein